MKKIITLLIAVGSITSVFAQDREEAKRVILGGKRTTKTYPSQDPRDVVTGDRRVYDERDSRYPGEGSRETRINQINREYDAKIQSVRNNRHLSSAEKDRMIRQLEQDRTRRIREVNEDYRRNRDDDRRYEERRRDRDYEDDDDDYKYKKDKKNKGNKGNNGKHLGWEKGKGNPHKGRY